MSVFYDRDSAEIITRLQQGDIGVLRTDTLYGVVARAQDQAAVERVYAVRQRDEHKPCIILIADASQMLGAPEGVVANFAKQHWPGPFSIIVPSPTAPDYLTRGGESLAYRVPADEELRMLLWHTGPLIAPSANTQGESPAKNIVEAQTYFGDTVDFYVDSGTVENAGPSQVWTSENGEMKRLR